MPSPRHRDPYRIFLLRVELCLFIELAYGGMSVSVADAAPVLLQACKLIFYVVQNRNSVLMCSVLVVVGTYQALKRQARLTITALKQLSHC